MTSNIGGVRRCKSAFANDKLSILLCYPMGQCRGLPVGSKRLIF